MSLLGRNLEAMICEIVRIVAVALNVFVNTKEYYPDLIILGHRG